MKLLKLEQVRDGKYLRNYELTYENRGGHEKKYEIVSRKTLRSIEDLGKATSGISIVAIYQGKLLLLKEFRMGVNDYVYNLCAGMLEDGEAIEDCIRRELYEETGLSLKRIIDILPPSFAAVAISDVKTQIVLIEAEGEISDAHMSENEKIEAGFYTEEEVAKLIETEVFSSRAQSVAYFFSRGFFVP